MTTPSRWHRFSVIYAWGLLFLAPVWVAATGGDESQLSVVREEGGPLWPMVLTWLLLGAAALAPVAQIVVALKLYRPQRSISRVGAAAGGIAVCGLACLVILVPGGGVVMVFGALLPGAALGELLSRVVPVSMLQARKGASLAASITGGVAGLVLFYLFFQWGIEHVWTDALSVIPYALSLWALAASAAFLVWYLGRAGGGR